MSNDLLIRFRGDSACDVAHWDSGDHERNTVSIQLDQQKTRAEKAEAEVEEWKARVDDLRKRLEGAYEECAKTAEGFYCSMSSIGSLHGVGINDAARAIAAAIRKAKGPLQATQETQG